jgi:hypothetical protein
VVKDEEVQEKELQKICGSEQGSLQSREEQYQSRLLDLEGCVSKYQRIVDS